MSSFQFSRRKLLQASGMAATLTALSVLPRAAFASTDWPNKPITLLVHTDPGSAADTYARKLAQVIEPELNQSIVVLNRVGGNGAVQMGSLMTAPADGYTLGVSTASHLSVLRTLVRDRFKLDDFDWIARVQLETFMTVVREDAPWATLQEFVADARKANPVFNIGGQGSPGSAHNIHIHILARAAGFQFNWIPFQGGMQQLTMLLGENGLKVTSQNPQTVMAFLKDRKVRALGVQGNHRLESAPDVPTYRESGIDADPDWLQMRGIIARKGTPVEIQQKIVQAIKRGIQAAAWKDYMRQSSLQDGFLDTQENTAYIHKLDATTAYWLAQLGLIE